MTKKWFDFDNDKFWLELDRATSSNDWLDRYENKVYRELDIRRKQKAYAQARRTNV